MQLSEQLQDHLDTCAAVDDEHCRPQVGGWNQPPGWAVQLAQDELSVDAPWCHLHRRAWELVEEHEG